MPLSIPFAGSWGLRRDLWEAPAGGASPFNPVCRELGAPPCVGSRFSALSFFQSRLPGVGGSAPPPLQPETRAAFNPVCRELGAPP